MSAGPPSDAAGPRPGGFAMKPYWQVLGLIAFFGLAPWVIVYIAVVIADLNGCIISATEVLPCMIWGADRGETLFGLAGFADFAYISLSVAVLLALICLALLALSYMAWRRKMQGVKDFTRIEVNYFYYALSFIGIVGLGILTLAGWLPGPVIFLVIFAAIFWIFSFLMSLSLSIRDRVKSK
jgi:hypothetical protein